MIATYPQALEYLHHQLPMFQQQGGSALKKFDLSNITTLLERIGQPQRQYPTVHIAGTNGKGSSAHQIAAVLQASGYRTGLYTSPHLRDFTERIRVDGEEVSQGQVVAFINQWQPVVDDIQPSFFEWSVALAYQHFAESKVDIAVIETGMGGRLDGTNVITPLVSLITNISRDHEQWLGATLEAIASHKAGIIKAGVPIIIGEDQPEVRSVFEAEASRLSAPMTLAFGKWQVRRDGDGYTLLQDGYPYLSQLMPELKGGYQMRNLPGIMCTLMELKAQGFDKITSKSIRVGIEQTITLTGLKGRWQVLQPQPLTIADTGHNEAGIRVVLEELEKTPFRQLHWVWGMVADKARQEILGLLPKEATYYWCKPEIPRGLAAQTLAEEASQLGLQGQAYGSVAEARAAAEAAAGAEDMILIGGSTFVVAELTDL